MSLEKKLQNQSHSGADLKLKKRSDGATVVEKIMHFDLKRNIKSIEKQKKFKPYLTSAYEIKSIPVDSVVIDDSKKITIEMPYIEGVNGSFFAINGNKNTATDLKSTLNSYLIDLLSKSTIVEVDEAVFLNKIESIRRSNVPKDIENSTSIAIEFSKKICRKKLKIPMSFCHGDLTLSNMIIKNNTLYIFDFLDGFIDSPLQDAAKLMQDMKHGWSFRKQNGSVKLKGELFCESSYPSIIETFEMMYKDEMILLEILTVLRIAPYISPDDEMTKKWFNKTINSIVYGLKK